MSVPSGSSTGIYYVTVSGYFSSGFFPVSGDYTLAFQEPPKFIKAEQLQAIKDMWVDNCWVTMQNLPVVRALAAHAPRADTACRCVCGTVCGTAILIVAARLAV